jgi:hypothetical protein
LNNDDDSDSVKDCTGTLRELHGQLGEKYFDYFVFNIVDYIRVDCDLLRPGALTVAHSRKLSATLGGSTSTRP